MPQNIAKTLVKIAIKYLAYVSSPKLRVTGQAQAASSTHKASSANAQIAISKKLVTKNSKIAVKTEKLPDGRIRYYAKERASKKLGPTRGSSHVTEHNPNTGQVRAWSESYDQLGNVNRVHPKMIDGQKIHGQHYSLTKAELKMSVKKPGGPQ